MPDNFIDNREHLITITRATNAQIANTFLQKNPENKITYKAMTTDNGPPWIPERYHEIDHCLVRKCWRNSVIDITTDPHTNINTDHYMMTAEIRQALKAKVDTQYEQSLNNVSIPDGNEEDVLNFSTTAFLNS